MYVYTFYISMKQLLYCMFYIHNGNTFIFLALNVFLTLNIFWWDLVKLYLKPHLNSIKKIKNSAKKNIYIF